METKLFEVRDRATFIPMMATSLSFNTPQEFYLLESAGFSGPQHYVILSRLEGLETQYDEHAWGGGARTVPYAHQYIQAHWAELKSGDVIDVEFILGETQKPKTPQALG